MLLYSKYPCVVNVNPVVTPGLYLFKVFPFLTGVGVHGIEARCSDFPLTSCLGGWGRGGCASVTHFGVGCFWSGEHWAETSSSRVRKKKLVVQEGGQKGRRTKGGREGFQFCRGQ